MLPFSTTVIVLSKAERCVVTALSWVASDAGSAEIKDVWSAVRFVF